MKKRLNWKIFLFSIIIVYLFAFIGSLFTSSNVSSPWYLENKPSITPPNYIFPIVWNILFFLLALSLAFSYESSRNKILALKLYLINLILNFLWSVLFFGLKNPFYAFIDLILLWFSILSLIIYNWNISRKSACLLIPYLVWVSFAGILNFLFI